MRAFACGARRIGGRQGHAPACADGGGGERLWRAAATTYGREAWRQEVRIRPVADGVDGAPNGIKRAKMVVV